MGWLGVGNIARFPLIAKEVVYKSSLVSVIMYWNEVWCLQENEFGILRRKDRSMVSSVCGVQLKYKRELLS